MDKSKLPYSKPGLDKLEPGTTAHEMANKAFAGVLRKPAAGGAGAGAIVPDEPKAPMQKPKVFWA